jgi:hypothetical protein
MFVTLMMEAIRSSETLVFIRATRRRIHEGGILQVLTLSKLKYRYTDYFRRTEYQRQK